MSNNNSFSQRHPRWNGLLSIIIVIGMVILSVLFANWLIKTVSYGISEFVVFLSEFVSNTDKLIVVAMITGSVSIVGVVISSIIAKYVEYKYNVKKYLYDKREEPYKQFIEIIYKLMEDTKKPENEKMTEEQMVKMFIEFSKGLTLWGSNRVVKKWLRYRQMVIDSTGNVDAKKMMFVLEDIIYEIRKDVGLGRKLGKGDMLSFFINDIENLKKQGSF